jgi:putative spermidine/putrescine transport system substrate-binding protein
MSGKHPTTTLDLFNTTAFPGKRCLYKIPQTAGTLEFPLLADGVAPAQHYPLDIPRALKKLDSIKSSIVWWSGGAQSVQFILDGECDMGTTWHGRPAALALADPNVPMGITWKDSLLTRAPFSIIKNTTHMKAAQTALAFAYQVDSQCGLINRVGYGVPFKESCLNAFAKQWSETKEHQAMGIPQNDDWYSKNYPSVLDQFNAWLTK